MSDKDEKALNQPAEEEVSSPTTPVDEPKATEEVTEPEAPEISEPEEKVAETEETEPKKGLNTRVRELNTRTKVAEEKALSLEEKLTELTDQGRSSVQTPNMGTDVPQNSLQEPIVKEGEVVTVHELNQRVRAREGMLLQQMDSRSELRSRQNESINRIKTESSEVIRKYPELDPKSKTFNRELSDTITDATEAFVRAKPYTASVTNFVDRLMKPYKGAVTKEVGKQTEEMAKQASQGAIKPTSIRKEDKSAKEKSIKELEKDLGVLQS